MDNLWYKANGSYADHYFVKFLEHLVLTCSRWLVVHFLPHFVIVDTGWDSASIDGKNQGAQQLA